MNWTDVMQAISALFSVLIMIVGFILINIQIKQINNSILSNTNNYVYTQTNEFIKYIIEHNLREFFYENVPFVGNSAKKQAVWAACEIACCYFEFVFLEKKNYHKGIFNKWENYISTIYLNSPILREYILLRKDWYSDEMISFFDTLRAKSLNI